METSIKRMLTPQALRARKLRLLSTQHRTVQGQPRLAVLSGAVRRRGRKCCRIFIVTPLRYQDSWKKLRRWRTKGTYRGWMVEEYWCDQNTPHLTHFYKDVGLLLRSSGVSKRTKSSRDKDFLYNRLHSCMMRSKLKHNKQMQKLLRQSW